MQFGLTEPKKLCYKKNYKYKWYSSHVVDVAKGETRKVGKGPNHSSKHLILLVDQESSTHPQQGNEYNMQAHIGHFKLWTF